MSLVGFRTGTFERRPIAGAAVTMVMTFLLIFWSGSSAPAEERRGVAVGGSVGLAIGLINKLSEGKAAGKKSSSGGSRSSSNTSKKSKSVSVRSKDDDEPKKKQAKKSNSGSGSSKSAKKRPTDEDEAISAKSRTNGKGGEPDGSDAADTDERAAPAVQARPETEAAEPSGSATGTVPAAAGGMIISTAAEVQAAQEHLRYLGYEVDEPAGVVDLQTKIAIMKFQDSIGEPTTGDLTTG